MGNAKVVTIEKSQDHEQIFLEHYDWLLKSARDLCHGSREEAEDLVQDMYVNFVLSQATVDIRNADSLRGYLYRTLKNLFIRKSRRNRDHSSHLTISDFDSLEIALSSVDGNELLLVRSRLSEICEYARIRRLTHKTGSVLILRFFFGYLPSEIARVLKMNRAAVDRLTHTARLEAKAFVSRPGALDCLDRKPRNQRRPSRNTDTGQPITNLPDDPAELKAELRRRIFSWCDVPCFSKGDLSAIYARTSDTPLSTVELSHLVSCRQCLDATNELLGIPSLDMHFSSDDGGSDDKTPPNNSQRGAQNKMRLRRKQREAFEHRPAQLNIAVNGLVLGTAVVTGEVNEFQLSLKAVSHPENIEVFSEQGITLLHFDLLAVGFDGVPSQRTHIELSDNRSMSLELVWNSDGLSANVLYHDLPRQDQIQAIVSDGLGNSPRGEVHAIDVPVAPEKNPGRWRLLLNWITSAHFASPLPIALSIGLILIAAGVTIRYSSTHKHVHPEIPEALLEGSIHTEDALIPYKGAAHRRFSYEVLQDNGQIIENGTVDTLRSKGGARRALRLFNDQGKLLAGHWVDATGKATDRSFRGKLQPKLRQSEPAAPSIWMQVPEADSFKALAGASPSLTAKQVTDGIEIDYARTASSDIPTVIQASLTLTQDTKRPIRETVRISDHRRIREYRFQELTYECLPASPRLESDFAPPVTKPSEDITEGGVANETSSAHVTLEALLLLSNLGPEVERVVNVERTPNGETRIDGVFETAAQRNQVARIFAPLSHSRRFTVDLHAADEPITATQSTARIEFQVFDPISIESQRIPLDRELRSALTGSGTSQSDLTAQVHELATRALDHCSLLHREAWTVHQIAAINFTTAELQAMLPEEKMLWLTLLDRHLRAFESDRTALESDLSSLGRSEWQGSFDTSPPTVTSVSDLRSASLTLTQQTERLDRLLTAGMTLSSSGLPANNTPESIGQLMATLREQESKLHDTVEHLQSFGQR